MLPNSTESLAWRHGHILSSGPDGCLIALDGSSVEGTIVPNHNLKRTSEWENNEAAFHELIVAACRQGDTDLGATIDRLYNEPDAWNGAFVLVTFS